MIVAKVDLYTNILEERIRRILQDRSLLEKYNESQRREKELLERIRELEIENQKLKTLPPKEQKQKQEILANQFRETSQGLTASELRNKALAFWKDGKYTDPDKALTYLNKAISLDSNYFYAYNSRGNAWYFKGDYDRAISDFNRAIELNPKDPKAYKNRGNVWYFKGDYERAILDYNTAIELNPRYAKALYNLAYLYSVQNNKTKSLKSLELALQNGFTEFDLIKKDPDLKNIRDAQEFKILLDKHKQ